MIAALYGSGFHPFSATLIPLITITLTLALERVAPYEARWNREHSGDTRLYRYWYWARTRP